LASEFKPTKDELIEMIKANNMVEDFLTWLRKNVSEDLDAVSLKDLDYELLYRYASEKGLLRFHDDLETQASQDDTQIEEEELRSPTKPKKIRKKK